MIAVQLNPPSTEKGRGATVLPLALPPLPVELCVDAVKGKTQKTSKISPIAAVLH